MRVFVAGAAGMIGRQLVPELLAAGHQVTGATRSADRARSIQAQGAESVVVDVFDAPALTRAVVDARPDAVIHELTALPQRFDTRHMERTFAANDRIRTEGMANLLAAAQAAGARRILAQSIAFGYAPGPRGTVHRESDPLLDGASAGEFGRSARAVSELERMVRGADGIVLRYGYIYGPATQFGPGGAMLEDLRRRRLPIVGRGEGVWSLIHVRDTATATVAALEHGEPGAAYNVVDDEPALVADWLPSLACAVGAPRPLRIPAFVARLAAGSYAVAAMTEGQGASNALARGQLGWAPRYPTWREGFQALG